MRRAALPWMMWSLGAVYYLYGYVHRVAPSAMIDTLMRDFSVSATALGYLAAAYWYAYAILQIPAGIALDRIGPRRILAAAALVCAVGGVIFALAPSIEIAIAGRLLIGASVAVGYIGSLKLALMWFPLRRYALLAGLTLLFGMIGAVIGQGPLATLIDSTGWRPVMLGTAGFALLIAALTWFARRAPSPSTFHEPARPRHPRPLRHAARTPQVWIAALFTTAISVPIAVFPTLWGVAYLMQVYGFDRPVAASTNSIMLVGWAVGGPFVGWLSDRIGRRKSPIVIGAAAALACWLILVFVPALPSGAMYVLFFVTGCAHGGVVLGFALATEHGTRAASGAATGLVNTCLMGTAALCQSVIGILLDAGWQGRIDEGVRIYPPEAFHNAFLLLPAMAVVALIASLLVRETFCHEVEAR